MKKFSYLELKKIPRGTAFPSGVNSHILDGFSSSLGCKDFDDLAKDAELKRKHGVLFIQDKSGVIIGSLTYRSGIIQKFELLEVPDLRLHKPVRVMFVKKNLNDNVEFGCHKKGAEV